MPARLPFLGTEACSVICCNVVEHAGHCRALPVTLERGQKYSDGIHSVGVKNSWMVVQHAENHGQRSLAVRNKERRMPRRYVFASAIGAIALALSAAGASAQSSGSDNLVRVSDGGDCGWYAISVCTRSRRGARRGASDFGGRVVDTGNVDGFRPGYYCAVMGPSNRRRAENRMWRMQDAGASSAYIKQGCEF
jgi:hypothetical protein